MKKFLLLILCLIPSPLLAQVQSFEYTIKLTGQELDLIGEGLGTQPFKLVAPLLQKLREQVAAQQASKPEEKKD